MQSIAKITESEIENFTINLLEKQGFAYIYGPDIAPDSENPERDSLSFLLYTAPSGILREENIGSHAETWSSRRGNWVKNWFVGNSDKPLNRKWSEKSNVQKMHISESDQCIFYYTKQQC